ncbi:MAG: hypothetical protein ACTSV3_05345 [Candidatus Thorarchaeota archaeon]|nr:MAG: hypothetical protein DRP09_06400 [Candidatus Thorarchaeota archaeon]
MWQAHTQHPNRDSVAVLATNQMGDPVTKREVELVIVSPDGSRFIVTRLTDLQGIALFELEGVAKGEWTITVSCTQQPGRPTDSSTTMKRTFIATV